MIWLSEAANAVLAPAFCSSAGELLLGCGAVNSSALLALSALSAKVAVAGFALVSPADPVRVTVSLVAIALLLASADAGYEQTWTRRQADWRCPRYLLPTLSLAATGAGASGI